MQKTENKAIPLTNVFNNIILEFTDEQGKLHKFPNLRLAGA